MELELVNTRTIGFIVVQSACIPWRIPAFDSTPTPLLRWTMFLLLDHICRPFCHGVRGGLDISGWIHGEDTGVDYTQVPDSVDL